MASISRRSFHRTALATMLLSATGRGRAATMTRRTRVVLLLSGSIADGGWGQLAYEGLAELSTSPDFKTAYAENITLAQMQQVIRGYSDDGFDLLIGHGFEFSSAMLDVAPDYPAQKYFVTSFLPQTAVPKNMLFVNMGYIDASYAAGVLAALISAKKVAVGFVGGDDDPNQQRMKRAFIAGAQHAVPGIKALGIITGDYDNAARGKEAAATLAGNGADVIWHAADVTGLGAIQGATAAGVKVIGCYSDQTALAPNNMATSFEMNLSGMVKMVAGAVASGNFAGGTEWRPPVNEMWLLRAGKNGEYNPQLVSASEWIAFQKVWSGLASRKIEASKLVP